MFDFTLCPLFFDKTGIVFLFFFNLSLFSLNFTAAHAHVSYVRLVTSLIRYMV